MTKKFTKKIRFASKYLGLVMCMLLFLAAGVQSANAQNLTVKAYGSLTLDVSVLDNIFGTVTVNDTVRTADYSGNLLTSNLPTSVAGFGGVQVVFANRNVFEPPISIAQVDALIDYVKAGGILIGNFEGVPISGTSTTAGDYIGSSLLCNAVNLVSSPGNSSGISPMPQNHPGNGALLLNSSGAASVVTTTTYSVIYNVPSENIIFSEYNYAGCGGEGALDIVVPAYPGCSSACGVNGFAFLSGENIGAMNAEDATVGGRNNTQANINYAQLMYDFLYDPAAMATRRAWSTISTNNNTTCAPALAPVPCLSCSAGTTAPTLSSTTISNVCPATTVNLTTITASNLPASTTLTWHTGTPATTANKITGTAVAAGIYYAAFFDATNNCYSGASGSATTAVTATVNSCVTPCNAGTVAPVVH